MTEGQSNVIHLLLPEVLCRHRDELRGGKVNVDVTINTGCTSLMCHRTSVRWRKWLGYRMLREDWLLGNKKNKKKLYRQKSKYTCSPAKKCHLADFPENLINKFLEVSWLWSFMSHSIRVCDPADDKKQLRCLRWDGRHAQACPCSFHLSLFPNIPCIDSAPSHPWTTDL